MSSFSPSGVSNISISGSTDTKITTPSIGNISCPLANTEYSYALPAGTRWFSLIVREGGLLQMAFMAGQSNVTFATISPGYQYESPTLPLDSSLTVYFQCKKANQTVEIVSWA